MSAPPHLKDRIFAIAQRLRQFIPQPKPKAPKMAKSWAGLKPGDVLLHRDRGTLWAVDTVNSEGARLFQIGDKPAQMALTQKERSHLENWTFQFVKLSAKERKQRKV